MTTGKVFQHTADIYQDQAQILYNYYRTAAEKIVSEEKAIEAEKASLLDRQAANAKKRNDSKNYAIIGAVAAGVGLIAGIFVPFLFVLAAAGLVAGLKFYLDYKHTFAEDAEIVQNLQNADMRYYQIRRDYAVEKMGVAYVPVAVKVPFEDSSIVIDQTGNVENTPFRLNVLHQPGELQDSVQSLQDSMRSIPIVEGTESSEEVSTSDYSLSVQSLTLHDYVGNIDRQLRNVSYLLGDSENIDVELPAVHPDSEEADALDAFATTTPGNYPVINVFGNNFEEKLSQFADLNRYKNQLNATSTGASDGMTSLMGQLASSIEILTKEKNASSSLLVGYTSKIFANVLKAGYTHYSPDLEAEEIERIRNTEFDYQDSVNDYVPFSLNKSSIVKLDVFSNNWVAEDGSRTSLPFSMQQVSEEVLAPVITALLEENRIERLKIYNNIEDQKRSYLEKWSSEVGEYYRDNRKAADELITHMREAYADYMSSYNMYKSLQNTADSMKTGGIENTEVTAIDAEAEMIAGFEEQTKHCNEQQEQFADFMDRIQDDINDITHDFAHIDYYEGLLRDEVSHDTAVAMSGIHQLSDRRKALVAVSPYLAAKAELQPAPVWTEELTSSLGRNLEEQVSEKLEDLARLQGNAETEEEREEN